MKSIENGIKKMLESMPLESVVQFCVYRLAKYKSEDPMFCVLMIVFQKMGFLSADFYTNKILDLVKDDKDSVLDFLDEIRSDVLFDRGDENA